MAEFFLFKSPLAHEALLTVVQEQAASLGYTLLLDQSPPPEVSTFLSRQRGPIHGFDVRGLYGPGDWTLWKNVGAALQCPWLAFILQLKAFWELLAYRGLEEVDLFSPLPEAWEEDEAYEATWRGHPATVAALWGEPLSKIERYFQSWVAIGQTPDAFGPRTIAYLTDQYSYGEMWQVLDVMKAFGAPDLLAPSARLHTFQTKA